MKVNGKLQGWVHLQTEAAEETYIVGMFVNASTFSIIKVISNQTLQLRDEMYCMHCQLPIEVYIKHRTVTYTYI